jgi:hypothetical protein
MQLMPDGRSVDQARFEYWVEITKNNDNLSLIDGLNSMRTYFKNFYKCSTSKNVHKLLQVLDTITQPDTTNET